MGPGFGVPRDPPSAVEAARHLCQESRVVLTSLRGGPPVVARGELATDLMDLRDIVKAVLSESVTNSNNNTTSTSTSTSTTTATTGSKQTPNNLTESVSLHLVQETVPPTPPVAAVVEPTVASPDVSEGQLLLETSLLVDELGDGTVFVEPPSPQSQQQPPLTPPIHPHHRLDYVDHPPPHTWAEDVGPFARPFLAVIVDPRAAGPHTLVALRALFRLVEQGSLLQPSLTTTTTTKSNPQQQPHHPYTVLFESLTKGVLSCKFEQTDAGADEAVEMAIADLLALLVKQNQRSMRPETLMEAFNTVFVTRNTFVHSPAMCYHFEDVLTAIVSSVFSDFHPAATLILEFLVNQLLHTPLVGGDVVDESMREAQMAHAATRLLCLRLVNCALRTGWDNDHFVELCNTNKNGGGDVEKSYAASFEDTAAAATTTTTDSLNIQTKNSMEEKEEALLLRIIKDDLCLSLLMTGQAIWTYHDASSNISPGLISLDVLAEICNTLSTLWHTKPLRKHLVAQFETIFTGFYQRALVLLRKRTHPIDSITFNADLVFDAEVEVILESLADLLCLHDFRHSISDGDGGSLETLFATYDCHMSRSDVAAGLMVELCRCCGGCVNEEGDAVMTPSSSVTGTPAPTASSGASTPAMSRSSSFGEMPSRAVPNDEMWRPVPPHLKELCAQALMGAMKCLFRDDKASKETLAQRSQRELTIMLSGEELQHDPCDPDAENDSERLTTKRVQDSTNENEENDHFLRNIKSKKRLMRKGAMLFNQKASRGVDFLVAAGLFADPPTPAMVASFLRNGIVVGLNKHAVGAYLGEAGKSRVAGKSPPDWERDWFHKEVLPCYCSLFRFEGQSLLDGLRMFLSSFRLPGEAQQIDRILQAFSDTCGAVCEESMNGRLKLFSTDPKRASDAAYLLSFSIIMLNTDLHNANIREDRKMKLEDFIKNNTDYGRDITDKGKEFPREFLEGIYESIKEEEIRTEGEGADGCMTIERWKDVLRGSTNEEQKYSMPSLHDAEDLTELVLEHVWIPIMSAIGAFWGIARSEDAMFDPNPVAKHPNDGPQNGNMLGVQGARLGMDMAIEMLEGVLQLRRIDIFRRIFSCVCKYTGLVGDYATSANDRINAFANSLEAQSGLIVAMQVVRSASDDIGVDGWKLVWQMMFELRDLMMLGAGIDADDFRRQHVLRESEPDLLSNEARQNWNVWLVKGDISAQRPQRGSSGVSSVLGAFGRVLFGSDDDAYGTEAGEDGVSGVFNGTPSLHGKESLLIWDEHALSDDEDESTTESNFVAGIASPGKGQILRSIGAQFEHDLIRENVLLSRQTEMTVTGLERVDETRNRRLSPRARVRNRLARACDFHGLVSDSRFMTVEGIKTMLQSLLHVIDSQTLMEKSTYANQDVEDTSKAQAADVLDLRLPVPPAENFPLSPASATFAEVLVCEIALKNKDRLGSLWRDMLEPHYCKRMANVSVPVGDRSEARKIMIGSSTEKSVTGLLRLSACATNKDVADDILGIWSKIIPAPTDIPERSLLGILDKHVGGGLWRIVNNVDGFSKLGGPGWEGLLVLTTWCAARGGHLPPIHANGPLGTATLAEDDPALQAYRSLHLMLNTEEVRNKIPYNVVTCVRVVISAGESRCCSQLSVAGLDLLHNFLDQRGSTVLNLQADGVTSEAAMDEFWSNCWKATLEAMAYTAETAETSNVRQHALSMVTDCCLDKGGSAAPVGHLCSTLGDVCIPMAGRRVLDLRVGNAQVEGADELMIEFELCIKLIFKPLRHHLARIVDSGSDVLPLWKCMLSVLEDLLRDEKVKSPANSPTGKKLITDGTVRTMNELANEHLQNTIMFFIEAGLIIGDDGAANPGDFTAVTWDCVDRMGFCKPYVGDWKKAASNQSVASN